LAAVFSQSRRHFGCTSSLTMRNSSTCEGSVERGKRSQDSLLFWLWIWVALLPDSTGSHSEISIRQHTVYGAEETSTNS